MERMNITHPTGKHGCAIGSISEKGGQKKIYTEPLKEYVSLHWQPIEFMHAFHRVSGGVL